MRPAALVQSPESSKIMIITSDVIDSAPQGACNQVMGIPFGGLTLLIENLEGFPL